MPPTLSVVLANYNHGRYLKRCIEATVNQSRPPDEYIILDDGSTDDSVAIIERYARQYNFIKVLRHERNQGLMVAASRVMQEARGDYIYQEAADDCVLPGFFESAMDAAMAHPKLDVVFGDSSTVNEKGERVAFNKALPFREAGVVSPKQILARYLEVMAPFVGINSITRRASYCHAFELSKGLGYFVDTFMVTTMAAGTGAYYLDREVAQFTSSPIGLTGSSMASVDKTATVWAELCRLLRQEDLSAIFPDPYPRAIEEHFRRHHIWALVHDENHRVVSAVDRPVHTLHAKGGLSRKLSYLLDWVVTQYAKKRSRRFREDIRRRFNEALEKKGIPLAEMNWDLLSELDSWEPHWRKNGQI
jgi:glycosyltransferase involved in cell wall biosynthesis